MQYDILRRRSGRSSAFGPAVIREVNISAQNCAAGEKAYRRKNANKPVYNLSLGYGDCRIRELMLSYRRQESRINSS